ncbi:unnamed protein product [Schistocephalus solidus]|uniref:Uncharacterized protein n=1 Tax=Schistocephalus solidus TaxID=70667 RepID=A0A3P7BUP2_SCHSO|nr:unnamed protein product [Schistocephalus solidus]
MTREVQQPRGQSAFEEGNLEKADLPPSTATPPKANDHNQANAADSRDSLDYAGDDLIRRAEMRAHERQKRLMHEVGIDEASGYNERWDGGAHLDRSADHSPRPASIVGPPGPAEGQDPRHLTQKQLLERHMTDGRFINYVNRPPWHTTLDDNGTANGSRRRVEEPSPQNGPRDQRTTNQMDFPSYTVSEMSAARPLATNSRYERCTWLPNLAPDFDIEKRNKRLPASRVQQNHGEDSRDVGNGSSAALSALLDLRKMSRCIECWPKSLLKLTEIAVKKRHSTRSSAMSQEYRCSVVEVPTNYEPPYLRVMIHQLHA